MKKRGLTWLPDELYGRGVKMRNEEGIRVGEKYKILIMVILLSICCFVMYYFHMILEVEVVFSHLFYIPIILAALWWRKKGLIVAIFLAALLVFSHNFIRMDIEVVNDLIRAAMFIAIAFVVSVLEERVIVQKKKYIERLEEQVDERTKEIMDEKNYVRHLIESSPDFQMTLDKDGRIMDVNKAFEEIVGKNREGVIGTSVYEYLPKQETGKFIAEIFKKEKVRNVELTVDILGKGDIICNFSGTVFTTSEGQKGIYASGRNVTEQKQKVDELEKYKKVTIGREVRIIELKNKIEVLEEKMKRGEKNGKI